MHNNKKNNETCILHPIVVDIFVAILIIDPPCDDPPTPPPAEWHSPPSSSLPRMSLDASAITIANADHLRQGYCCPHCRWGGGIPVNLASRQDNNTMCNELQSNNLAHKGGGREGGLIFYGLGAG
jgi:hypothetical protein